MTDPKIEMEVPLQVREFAKKSIDQAEKAITSFMDSASKSVDLVPGPMTDIAKQTLAITEKNLNASFQHARKLMQAKDINAVMQLYLDSSIGRKTACHEAIFGFVMGHDLRRLFVSL